MKENMTLSQTVRKCKDFEVEFVDLKTVDILGRNHSLILPFSMLNENTMEKGIGFDASSYGFSKPEKSDMVLIPDLQTMRIDPFRDKKTVIFFSNIHLTDENRSRFSSDPRYVAEKSEKFLLNSKLASNAFFSPEFEFFIFREANFRVAEDGNCYYLRKDSEEKRNFYQTSSPDDEFVDFKNEAVSILEKMGIEIKYHHHEVAVNQHEIEVKFSSLLQTCDHSILIKYVLFNLAKKNNFFITFMPKPFYGKAGNGWHIHQYLTKGNENIFFSKGKYANMSEQAFSYITGILFHSNSLCAFSNPSTNSYKRLVKGFEAPVNAIFAISNRNAAIRIPSYVEDKETRIEYRSGDASSNPYFFLSSMLLAGIDGIKKNLKPEKFNYGPFDGDMPDAHFLKNKIKELPQSLTESLDCLERDCEYLKVDNVFDENLIGQWIKLKRKETNEVNLVPHPKEFELYFNF